ncbi:MAG TPA: hypothetical protein VMZ28_12405 [Kofleriaceae bacterium]|nr:hypothetical protein [Kofleriaceae bacterium]
MEFSREEILACAKVQLIIAGADGLSDAEMRAANDIGRGFGAPEDLIEEIKRFDYKNARLEDHLNDNLKKMAHAFLYFAIKVSHADGYSEKEQGLIKKSARALGVSDATVAALEGLVSAESGLRMARVALLSNASSH